MPHCSVDPPELRPVGRDSFAACYLYEEAEVGKAEVVA